MKFTDFEVLRVGQTVVLSCFTDQTPAGSKAQVAIDCESQGMAEMYEAMFSRLVHAANVCESMSDDSLAATDKLSKGQNHE